MAKQTAARRRERENKHGLTANGSAPFDRQSDRPIGTPRPPANDNIGVQGLPACLAVTDDEVMLLHRYLSREILGLFS
jgi:hypothetical protein